MDLIELKTNNKFSGYETGLRKQLDRIKAHSLLYGRICHPIFVWEQTKEVVLGHCLVALAQEHPELQYTIICLPFSDWQEAQVFVVEYQLAQPYLSLWDKLEISLSCNEYWEQKELAKRNQGARNDLHTVTVEKLSSQDVNKIIAGKVGCSPTTVSNFTTIYFNGSKELTEKCKNGLSISAAYDILKGKPKKPKPKQNTGTATLQFEIVSCDIFAECEKNIDIGNKNIKRDNSIAIDQSVIVEKVTKSKIPDGNIWLVFHKKQGVLDIVKKSIDPERGKAYIKINSFIIKPKEDSDDMVILEADHINIGPNEYNRKDESDFEHAGNQAAPALLESSLTNDNQRGTL